MELQKNIYSAELGRYNEHIDYFSLKGGFVNEKDSTHDRQCSS
jgi:hypothetical protein